MLVWCDSPPFASLKACIIPRTCSYTAEKVGSIPLFNISTSDGHHADEYALRATVSVIFYPRALIAPCSFSGRFVWSICPVDTVVWVGYASFVVVVLLQRQTGRMS